MALKKFLLPLAITVSIISHSQTRFTEVMKSEMCKKVQDAARHAWQGYMKYAQGFDDLRPLTREGRNWYKHSMLMTPVEAFDTYIILGLTKEAGEAKNL